MVMLLTDNIKIQEVLLFPAMKPINTESVVVVGQEVPKEKTQSVPPKVEADHIAVPAVK